MTTPPPDKPRILPQMNRPAARLFAGILNPRWHYNPEGLLFYGDTIIPFSDRFPKDTELYRLLTTRPADNAEIG